MAIDDIKGLYNSGIKTSHKKKSFAQKLGPYVAAGMLLAYSPVIVNAQEKNKYTFDAKQYLNDASSKYKTTEVISFAVAGAALAAGWLSLLSKSPGADKFRNLCAFTFSVSGGIGLHSLSKDINDQ